MAESLTISSAFTEDPTLDLGGVRLCPLEPADWLAVQPFRGMERRVEEVVGPLPPPGKRVLGSFGEIIWAGHDHWIVAGLPDTAPEDLAPFALVAGQGSAWAGLSATGDPVPDLLARLTPLDTRHLGTGDVALTEVAHMRGLLIGQETGIDVLVPRSYADTLAREMHRALTLVAARASDFG